MRVGTSLPLRAPKAPGPVARWLRAHLPYAYFTRFSLLLGAALVSFVPLALWWLPTMFRSMLIQGWGGVFWTTCAAWMAAMTMLATRRVCLLYGAVRFQCEPLPARSDIVTIRELVLHGATAVPLIVAVVHLSWGEGALGYSALFAALSGTALAACLTLGAIALHGWIVAPGSDLPALILRTDAAWVQGFKSTPGRADRLKALFTRLLRRYRNYLGEGYLDSHGALLSGHAFAAALFAIYLAIYAAGWWLASPTRPGGTPVPALVLLLVVVTLMTWLFAGLAFFFDRHRVPVLLAVAIWSAAIANFTYSDHYFRLRDPSSASPLQEPPAIAARQGGYPLLTVVAVDGGGIQASAWAAEVLTAIYAQWPEFQQSVRFISSVSGGSVATMYFVEALSPDKRLDAAALERVRTLAGRAALREVAWGLAYPDLWRTFFPVPSFLRFESDRGWALERAWERDWTGAGKGLSGWVSGVNALWRPAVAFNATDVESGSRFVLGTFRVPNHWGQFVRSFHDEYPGRDVLLGTAARLSSAFTYVTPVSRAWPESAAISSRHIADGGYYDNYGVVTALQWLDEVIRHDASRPPHVAVVKIRSSKAGATSREPEDRPWWYQMPAPLSTLVHVRTTGQFERSEKELETQKLAWTRAYSVDVKDFTFQFCGERPPQSWQFSKREADAIRGNWTDPACGNGAMLRQLVEFARSVEGGK